MGVSTRLSTFAGRAWVAATLAYGTVRVALAGVFISDYGLNIYAFAVVELTSSLVLGLTTSRLARDYLDPSRRVRKRLVPLAVVAYMSPDVYVLAFAGRMPTRVLVPVLVIVACGLIATAIRFRRVRSDVT